MTFKRFFLFTIISVFFACSNTKYEYIVKDDLFRTTVKTGNFIELKKGKLFDGYYVYFRELSKKYSDKDNYYFEDEKMTVLARQFKEGKTVYNAMLDWKNKEQGI